MRCCIPSARYDALTRARHRAFMAPRLLGSLAAFAAFPVYLAMRGAPTALEVAAFAWLIAPILLSWFLSRTGRYEGAHVLSSLALAGLVMTVAMTTGGIESFAAVWLVVVPLEAALSASRRVVAFASALALSCAALLIALGHFDLLPAAGTERGLARRPDGVRRGLGDALCRGSRLRRGVAGAHQRVAALCRGRPLSPAGAQHERRDLASSPQRRGAVHLARGRSHAGHAGRAAAGHGLFDRVHVADRPAYLTALVGCRARRRGAQRRVPPAARRCPRPEHFRRFHLGRDALPAARTGLKRRPRSSP